MIARPHGFSYQTETMTEINLYPTPAIYLDSRATVEDPRCEKVGAWAWGLCNEAKALFALCRFDVSTGIHDSDYRCYATIIISSPNGQHGAAARWLIKE
jgi:hypothetical protein